MNLLELCLSPDRGGLELYMQKCSHQLKKSFTVTAVLSSNSKIKEYFNDVNTLFLKRKSSFSLINAYKLAKIIDKEQIEIMHLHWTKDLPIAVLAKLFSKQKPKLVQTRHMTMTRFKNDFYHKFLYKNLDGIICVSKAVETQVRKFIPKDICPKTQTIYLGVEEKPLMNNEQKQKFKNKIQTNENFVVSIVGRINEFKGQHLVIEAIKILKEKKLNIKAYIVGHAMSEQYLYGLQEQVKLLGLQDSIIFTGFTQDAYKYMQISDCVIMASKNETFGLVSVEAMMNKTAVIGANSGGVLEIIDDKESGLLFQSGDAKDLSQKIKLLYDNQDLRNTLAAKGHKKASDIFNNKQQFDILSNYIQNEVLNDRS